MRNHISGSPQVAVQARDIHKSTVHIHTSPPPTPTVPRQLPAPRLFLDREQTRAWLDHAWHTRHGPLWAGIEGPSGIGKTALVTAWGHQHQGRWPDGALYTDLTHTTPDTTLRGWLTALGHTHLPAETDQLRALWRTTTAHRALLVVVENTTAEIAQELFPAGPDCAGITTAHHDLTNLVAAGGHYTRLDGLSSTTVEELITQLLDRPVPAPVLDEAVTATGGIPLAATLTATVLTQTPRALLTETGQETVVPDRITHILTQLDDQAVTAAAMIAGFPGGWVDTDLVAAMTNISPEHTHHLLGELITTSLLVELGQGRYTVHDRVRPTLVQHLNPQQRPQMIDRAARFYRLRTAAVGRALNPWRWRIDAQAIELAEAAQKESGRWFADTQQAMTWADTHLDNIVALTHVLTDLGHPEPWQYADHLGPYVIARKPMQAAHQLYQLGLTAAQNTGPKETEGLMHQRWASLAHYRTNPNTPPREETARLLEHAEKALTAYRQAGHEVGIASALETLGGAHRAMGDLEAAAETFSQSEQHHLNLGRPRGAALQRRKRAETAADQGDLITAVGLWTDAHHALLDLEEPDLYQAGRALQGLTSAALATKTTDPVVLALVEMLCHQGLTNARTVGSIHQQAGIHITLADLAQLRKGRNQERQELSRALALLKPTGHPQTEEVRNRLEAVQTLLDLNGQR